MSRASDTSTHLNPALRPAHTAAVVARDEPEPEFASRRALPGHPPRLGIVGHAHLAFEDALRRVVLDNDLLRVVTLKLVAPRLEALQADHGSDIVERASRAGGVVVLIGVARVDLFDFLFGPDFSVELDAFD